MDELTRNIIDNVYKNSPKVVKSLNEEMLRYERNFNAKEYAKKVQSINSHKSSKNPVDMLT